MSTSLRAPAAAVAGNVRAHPPICAPPPIKIFTESVCPGRAIWAEGPLAGVYSTWLVAMVRILVGSRRPWLSDALATWSSGTKFEGPPLAAETFGQPAAHD